VLGYIENLARCTPAKVRKISEWTSTENSMEYNSVNFYEVLAGKPLFSSLYGMCVVTLN
jgi:hypothetical protein